MYRCRLNFTPYIVMRPVMHVRRRRDTLVSMERQLVALNDKIKDAEKEEKFSHMDTMLAMRDEYVRKINKMRDKIGY